MLVGRYIAEKIGMTYKEFKYQENEKVEKVEVRDIINDFISFDTPVMKGALEYFQQAIIYPKTAEDKKDKQLDYSVVVDGVRFDCGMGGLHSYSDGEVIEPSKDEYLIQSDVSGYYPSQTIKLNYPHRYDPYFRERYVEAYNDKAEGKKNGNKTQELLGKLIGNSLFGKFQSLYSQMYMPSLAFRIKWS